LVQPLAEEQWEVNSSNAQDSIAGTGIQRLQTFYLNRLFQPFSITYDLNGGTATIPATDCYRHIETIAVQWGSGARAAGSIQIRQIGGGDPRSEIAATKNASRDSHYTIQEGFQASAIFFYADIAKGKDASVIFESTLGDQQVNPGFFELSPASPFQNQVMLVLPVGSKRLPSGSDLKVSGTTSNGTEVSIVYQLLEIRNDLVEQAVP
jgi:hypothetical protein